VDRQGFAAKLQALIPQERRGADVPLAPMTTFRIGGPADWLVEVVSAGELRGVVAAARAHDVPVTVLGGGSNVLIADSGLRGVVLRVALKGIGQSGPRIVRAEAGITMNGLVRWTIARGLAGLERWAGTPGTVGGAIYGNAHFDGRDIGSLVRQVLVVAPDDGMRRLEAREMEFAYDRSRLQRTREILVWAEFGVEPGAADALREAARASLAYRKRTQPLALSSAGCVFQNPDRVRDRVPEGVPASAGALVDRAGLKGLRVGDASISEAHANFIVNHGRATARDVRALIERARAAVRARFGVELRDEVVMLGSFDV
jgi:UDP-N-acetylmuramate dehydrogenase